MKYLLGIDFGGGATKATLIDEAGRLIAEHTVEYPTLHPGADACEQDPADWINALCENTRALLQKSGVAPSAIAALAIDSATHTSLLCDSDFRPLRHAMHWTDSRSRKEAERHVKIGDCCALLPHASRLLGSRICGRPLDDRVGCAVMVEIARRMPAPADDIYYVFSVQEEVGCRGAKPAAFEIGPDLALIYDVTATGDTPGAKPMAVKLGGGVAVKIKDSSVICNAELVEELLATAKKNKITAQCEILTFGGTDTSAVQMTGYGCRAGALSLPCRYIHSGVEMIDLADAEAAVALTVAYLGGAKV